MALTDEQLARLRQQFPGLTVDNSCTVSYSHFAGNVSLGAGARISWSSLSTGTSVGDRSVLFGTRVGKGSAIAADCVIGAANEEPWTETRIGKSVRIGKGAIVLPGADVADGVIVPERAMVMPDTPDPASQPHGESLKDWLLEKLPQVHVLKLWQAARGDELLRVDYALNPGDIVLDVGGFQGDWAEVISQRSRATVHVFEPVRSFAEAIRKRLGDRVTVYDMGLAGRTREEMISLASESSSVIKDAAAERGEAGHERINLVAARGVLEELGVTPDRGEIALMKINIEGCEYELLEHLIEERLIGRIRHLQIQFHNFVPDASTRRNALRQHLRATHRPTFNYPFIWEGWTLL